MSPAVSRTVATTASLEAAFAYLGDFRNAEDWLPGTHSCVRVSGHGGVGTVYRSVSTLLGRRLELTHATTEAQHPTRIRLRSHREGFDGEVVFDLVETATGCEITCTAEVDASGMPGMGARLAPSRLPLLGSKAADRLRTQLDALVEPAPAGTGHGSRHRDRQSGRHRA